MKLPRLRVSNDTQVAVLAFAGAACAVIAQSEIVPPQVRIVAAALAAGCTAVLALKRQPGAPSPPSREERVQAVREAGRG